MMLFFMIKERTVFRIWMKKWTTRSKTFSRNTNLSFYQMVSIIGLIQIVQKPPLWDNQTSFYHNYPIGQSFKVNSIMIFMNRMIINRWLRAPILCRIIRIKVNMCRKSNQREKVKAQREKVKVLTRKI